MLSRRAAIVFGVGNLLTAALIVLGVFVGLPRFAPVDVVASGLCVLELTAAGALLSGVGWAPRVAALAAFTALALGLATVTALALTASWLAGVYGPVGRGGALILGFVAALLLPYLVVWPAVTLVFLGPTKQASP